MIWRLAEIEDTGWRTYFESYTKVFIESPPNIPLTAKISSFIFGDYALYRDIHTSKSNCQGDALELVAETEGGCSSR